MPVRVRYVGTELCPEGVVELIKEADKWVAEDTDEGEAIKLYEVWEDDDEKSHQRVIGRIAAGRWQSVVVLESAQ
jgi:hypothetical protein